MGIVNVNHLERGLSRIIEHINKENFQKFVGVYLDECDDIESAFVTLSHQRDLDAATGVWLDYIGAMLGIAREGRVDDVYREALRLQISITNSNGTPDNMINLMKEYTDGTYAKYSEGYGNAWGIINTNGETNIDYTAWTLLQEIKPAGTRFFLQHSTDKSFFPAWEIVVGSSEEIAGYLDGTETLCFFEWEDSNNFQVFDGNEVSDLELVTDSEGTIVTLIVIGVQDGTKGDVTWSWEINEECTH